MDKNAITDSNGRVMVERSVRYELVGVHAGKTIKLGGFQFTDGVCNVPQSAHDNFGRALRNFWSAYPAHEITDEMREASARMEDPATRRERERAEAQARREQAAAQREAESAEPTPSELAASREADGAVAPAANEDPALEPATSSQEKAGRGKGKRK